MSKALATAMTLYIDTNFFLYSGDKTSIFYSECTEFISYCQKNNITLVTSVETIQEIINYSKNVKQIEKGLEITSIVLNATDQLIPVYPSTIQIYLKQVEIYFKPSSRDLLHLATCIENDFKTVITYDKDFSKFVDIEAFTPNQYLAKYS